MKTNNASSMNFRIPKVWQILFQIQSRFIKDNPHISGEWITAGQ